MQDLQTAFYIIGIIYMTLATLVLLAITIFLLRLKASIDRIEKNVKDRIGGLINIIGLIGPSFIYKKIRDWMSK